ncbi:hypothetical protein GJ744_002790 [Endocarpon pusillum]|uniref:Uncharacterized protein n=1 Tax=Endocarpon pusillum TaxID=364733 RepID=A0A8H7ASC5_9EURO|nr:hypothetical protein GJ744_002790 [Endocarpon pusillum]
MPQSPFFYIDAAESHVNKLISVQADDWNRNFVPLKQLLCITAMMAFFPTFPISSHTKASADLLPLFSHVYHYPDYSQFDYPPAFDMGTVLSPFANPPVVNNAAMKLGPTRSTTAIHCL